MAIVDKPTGDGDGRIAPEQVFGGGVEQVLATPNVAPAPATLEEARNAPGRAREDRAADAAHRGRGHQVRVLPAGLGHRPGDGQGRGVDVLPAGGREGLPAGLRRRPPTCSPTATATTSASAPRSPSWPRSPTSTRSRCCPGTTASPGSTATAMTPRPVSCSTPTAPEPQEGRARVRAGARISVPDRDRARDDVAQAQPRGRQEPEGVTKPYCYHIHQFEELRPVLLDVVDYGQQLGLDMSYGDHEDAPGQLELNFRFDRPVRTADNITTYRQVCAAVGRKHGLLPTLHAQAIHRRVGQRPSPPLHARSTTNGINVFHDPDGPGAAVGVRAQLPGRDARALPGADVRRQPDRQLLLPHVGHRLLGPDLQELGLAEPDHDRARRRRRAVRVPRRRLLVQPVPDGRDAAARRPGRRAAQARPRARRSRATPTTCSRRARDREGARQPRRRARCAGRRRGRPQRDARAACTRSSTSTSATNGSATWRPSPTGSATNTSRCCP